MIGALVPDCSGSGGAGEAQSPDKGRSGLAAEQWGAGGGRLTGMPALVARLGDDFFGSEAAQRFDRGAYINELIIFNIQHEDHIRNILCQQAVFFFAFTQGDLDLFAFINIGVGSDQPQRFSLYVIRHDLSK